MSITCRIFLTSVSICLPDNTKWKTNQFLSIVGVVFVVSDGVFIARRLRLVTNSSWSIVIDVIYTTASDELIQFHYHREQTPGVTQTSSVASLGFQSTSCRPTVHLDSTLSLRSGKQKCEVVPEIWTNPF